MTNPHRGQATFTVDGKTYTMRGSIDAICALESISGKGMIAIIRELSDPELMSLSLTRQVLWAMLQEHHPEMTLQDAGELIPAAGGLKAITKSIEEALVRMSPDIAKEAGVDPHPQTAGQAQNGTGPHSSRSGAASEEIPTTSGGELRAN